MEHKIKEYWKYNHFELDVSDGFGAGGFSLETAKKKTFKINYQVLSKAEIEILEEPLLYHQYMILEKENSQKI